MGGYPWFPPINYVISLFLAWSLAPFVFGDGDIFNELVEVALGKFASISVRSVPIIDDFGETCTLGSLGKYLEVELDMVYKDGVVGHEPHLGGCILVLGGGCDICSYFFALLWCDFMLEEACVCVLGPRFDRFGVDQLDDVMDFHFLEVFFCRPWLRLGVFAISCMGGGVVQGPLCPYLFPFHCQLRPHLCCRKTRLPLLTFPYTGQCILPPSGPFRCILLGG